MKAVLINSVDRTVTDVVYDGSKSLKEWYRLLNCSMVEVATYIREDENGNDSIMVDEEGMLSYCDNFFTYHGAHQPFAGSGLVVGCDEEGETVDAKLTAKDIEPLVKFYNRAEVMQII